MTKILKIVLAGAALPAATQDGRVAALEARVAKRVQLDGPSASANRVQAAVQSSF